MISAIFLSSFLIISSSGLEPSLQAHRDKCKERPDSSITREHVDSRGDTALLRTNLCGDTLLFWTRSRNRKSEGLYVQHFNNGRLKCLGHYEHGHSVDTSSEWDEQGNLLSKEICSHDGRSCQWTAFHKTGQVANTSNRRDFLSCDTTLSWFPNGKLSERVIYGTRGDSDRTHIRWNSEGFKTDSSIYKAGDPKEKFHYFGNGRLKEHCVYKLDSADRLLVWNMERRDSATGQVVGSVKNGNGILIVTGPDGTKTVVHYIDGVDQSDLSDDQMSALLSGKDVPAPRFDRYPDGAIRCMYMDVGGDIGMIYAVCYTPDGKETSKVMKGDGTLIIPHSDGKGSEKRVFKSGKEVAPVK